MPRVRLLLPLCGILLCSAVALSEETSPVDPGPELRLLPLAEVRCGQPLPVEVEIRDADGVFDPRLYVRSQEGGRFAPVALREGASGAYRTVLSADEVAKGVEFYVEAFDGQGNGPSRSGSPDAPHRFDCAAAPVEVAPVIDAAAPVIIHSSVSRAVAGRSIPIEASFRGPSGLYAPTLYFRRIGTPSFTAQSLAELPSGTADAAADSIRGPAGSGRYVAEVPAAVTTGDVEYFLEAMDTQGNGPSSDGTRERPHVVRVVEPQPEGTAVDPQLALEACLSTAEDSGVDPTRLGPCRAEPTGLSASMLASHAWAVDLLREGRAAEAIAIATEVVQGAPEWPAAWFRLGQVHEAVSAWKSARDAWVRYLAVAPMAPEKPALVKRLARLQKELQREADAAAELTRRQEADRRLASRERWLSAPGHRLLLRGNLERLTGESYREAFLTGDVVGRFKWEAAPWLFAGLAASFGQNTNLETGKGDAVLAILPSVGLNLLALPSPRANGWSLISPFVAYEPRWMLLGPLRSLGNAPNQLEHRLVFGDHMEFGSVTLEVSTALDLHDAFETRSLQVAVGRRVGD
jgi:hypothetical protein